MENTIIIQDITYNLDDILEDCWHRLVKGTQSAKHPFHCPTLGTFNSGDIELRTVVLRKVIPSERTIIFHTDKRSPKITQLEKHNQLGWLFYDDKARIQIRIKAKAIIHYQDDLALSRWKDSRLESRRCYLVESAPSTFIDSPSDGLPENLTVKDLTEENVAPGYQNFTVVKTVVNEIDWLFLNHSGHRRARFFYEDGKEIRKEWVLP
ncbi:pyridoxamine 5'-phosphate oxidase family protein [Pelobium sp.]|nr:pyridoxamine 5'-phosphate oxidase family protein [Pelobium sp.]MDA9555840.1 pyridoxamine 5'-phosphate oxidase family protein [Pelobium sp.]